MFLVAFDTNNACGDRRAGRKFALKANAIPVNIVTDLLSRTPTPFSVSLTVSNERQLRELDAAWREIIGGRQARIEALEQAQGAVKSKALLGLRLIETSIRNHPGTGQVERLVHFLAGVYNGPRYPFDLTDLRALDTVLANACMAYLNYDRLGNEEVHHYLTGGADELNRWIRTYGIRARRGK